MLQSLGRLIHGAAMKLSLDPSVTALPTNTAESLALAAWYDAHPAVRRMWAIRDAEKLRVIVMLEPTVDNSDTHPAWLANGHAWARDLRSRTGGFVELELVDEPLINEIETDAEGDVIVAMCWRDPVLTITPVGDARHAAPGALTPTRRDANRYPNRAGVKAMRVKHSNQRPPDRLRHRS